MLRLNVPLDRSIFRMCGSYVTKSRGLVDWKGGEKAQSEKLLPHRHEESIADPQHPCKMYRHFSEHLKTQCLGEVGAEIE